MTAPTTTGRAAPSSEVPLGTGSTGTRVLGVLALVGKLSVFHLVGLLLVVAVGSNYSLFFERGAASGVDSGRTAASLLFACASTVVGFGLLALSSVPVLSAIGLTVGMGASLALIFGASLSRPAPSP